jgi:hypothetical protein
MILRRMRILMKKILPEVPKMAAKTPKRRRVTRKEKALKNTRR